MNPKSRSVEEPLEEFLRSKAKGGEGSGNYRRNLERCVEDFLEWLETDPRSGTTFSKIDERTFRRYARELTTRDLTPGTIRTYYAQVSAYIGWCVREGPLANYRSILDFGRNPRGKPSHIGRICLLRVMC